MNKITRLNGGSQSETHGQGLHLRELPEGVTPADSVGQELRAARLRRGEELNRVSHALRIGKGYLEAIELDLPEKLPGRAYAIGFVRSYAGYLGLDPRELVARYKNATFDSAETSSWSAPPPEREPIHVNRSWIAVALLVVGLLGYGVYQYARAPLATHSTATSPTNAEAAGRSVARGQHLPAPPHKVSQQMNPASPATGVTAGATATSSGGPIDAQQFSTSSGQVFGVQNHESRLVLRAQGLTHVLVQGPGGKVYINRLLHPGDVYRVPNLVGLSLTTPDGGAVLLELDGQAVGVAGKSGKITEALPLDPRAIVDRRGAGAPAQGNKATQ